MLRSALDIAAVAAFAFLLAGWSERAVAQLRLGTPETIEMIDQVTGNPEKGCGLRADYQFTDSVIRVEMLASRAEKGVNFAIQAYSPQSVTPSMQDIWLKTPTYFTVGMFSIGRINAKGFIEAKGRFETEAAKTVFRELSEGRAEISLVFEGMLPYSRVPVALPKPMPAQVAEAFVACGANLTE
ncbi:MAG: hypothetical protein C0519_06235 [Hyphomicrobium sp.]|jgi:hypothetical protein|nr:hypothetical protein [Hyphomicrobium sp.]PPD06026.1 MAG: hypothetical protein CTY28_15200 [Hyphomicrobium sp.]